MHSANTDHEVVIVGGGPVGLGVAIELGQRGIRTLVLEKYLSPQRIPKGQNLTQRTMEHFAAWGAEAALRAARTIPKEYGIGGLTAYGTLLGKYHYDWLQRELVKPFYFADNERLPQYATEAVLRSRAAELDSVDVRYGWTATAVEQGSDGVSVRASAGGDELVARARFAVGCDGSRSMVREAAGIDQTRSDHDRLMVLLVFRSSELHRLLERFPGKSYYNVLDPKLKGYWKFFGRVDLGSTWFFHAPVPPGTTRENFDFAGLLREAVGADFDLQIDYVGFWDLRFAIANHYRKGRVFIAGDAAHSHPPYGGYGINTGFEDARNLGWKMAAFLRGWGGEDLLDSYDAERRPVFASTARDFIEKAIASDRDFLGRCDPERDRDAFEREWGARANGAREEINAFEPNYEGSPVIADGSGTPSAVGEHRFEARAGHHLAPMALSSGNRLHEKMGAGLTLVSIDGREKDVDAFRSVASVLGVPLEVIQDDSAGDRARFASRYILLRPDLFVAWAGSELPADVEGVFRRTVGRL